MPGLSARSRAIPMVLGLAIPLLAGAPGRAQEAPPSPPTFELQEVEVAGKRPQLPSTTPASISVITADEIAGMGALTVADALRVLPEVRVKDSGGPGSLTSVSIRGSASTQVLILLDGVPINRPDQATVDLSTFPIQNVDRIEVLRGPFSAIYGSAALGGVINIVTRAAPQTVASSRIGSFGESANAVSLGGAAGGTTYLLQGIFTGSTGFAPDMDYSNSTTMAKLRWATAEDAAVSFTLNRLWHVDGTPGPLPVQDQMARTWEGRTLLDLTWRAGKVDGPGGLLRVYTLDDDVTFNSPGFVFQSDDVAHLWGAQGQVVLAPWARHLLTLGAEYQGQTVGHTDNTPSSFSDRGSDFGLYLQDDWQMSPSVLLSTGVREDAFELYGTQVNPRVGLVALLSDRLVMRAGAGRTFRAPSFDETAPAFSGNPSLQPESAWAYDLSFEYTLSPDLAVHLTGYYTDAVNLITSAPPTFTPMNVGHATVAGGSVEILGRLSDRWVIRASYTNQLARDVATGQDVIYIPRSLGSLELTYGFGPQAGVTLLVSAVGDRFADPANTMRVSGYWLTSLTVTWPVGDGYAVQAGIANVFDQAYQESLGFPEPGRRYFVVASKSF
jgi:vitamin B12 transporter